MSNFIKGMHDRLKWIVEDSTDITNGKISADVNNTLTKTSFMSFIKVQVIPFTKTKFQPEQIMHVDVPIENKYTKNLHIALPFSRHGFATFDHPMQVSCTMEANIPNSVMWSKDEQMLKQNQQNYLYNMLINDEAIRKLITHAVLLEHEYVLGNDRFTGKLKWGFLVTPINKNEIICTINTGINKKGMIKQKRIYDLKLRLALLQQIMKNIKELDYKDVNNTTTFYEGFVEELKRRECGENKVKIWL